MKIGSLKPKNEDIIPEGFVGFAFYVILALLLSFFMPESKLILIHGLVGSEYEYSSGVIILLIYLTPIYPLLILSNYLANQYLADTKSKSKKTIKGMINTTHFLVSLAPVAIGGALSFFLIKIRDALKEKSGFVASIADYWKIGDICGIAIYLSFISGYIGEAGQFFIKFSVFLYTLLICYVVISLLLSVFRIKR